MQKNLHLRDEIMCVGMVLNKGSMVIKRDHISTITGKSVMGNLQFGPKFKFRCQLLEREILNPPNWYIKKSW